MATKLTYNQIDGACINVQDYMTAAQKADGADGDLKVKFGDGTVKTIATDT